MKACYDYTGSVVLQFKSTVEFKFVGNVFMVTTLAHLHV